VLALQMAASISDINPAIDMNLDGAVTSLNAMILQHS